MKTTFKMLTAAAAISFGTAAQAQVSVSFLGGVGGLQAGETSFNDFESGTTAGIGGSGFVVIQGNPSGIGADPAVGGQGDFYLSVLGNGAAVFNFLGLEGGGAKRLGIDYGSADSYNTFTLGLSNASSVSYNGTQLINFIANGNQASSLTNGRLTFNPIAGLFITSLTIASSQAAAEVDNVGVISAVPEVGTWAMMLLGFGGVGFAMRRRTATAKLANA